MAAQQAKDALSGGSNANNRSLRLDSEEQEDDDTTSITGLIVNTIATAMTPTTRK